MATSQANPASTKKVPLVKTVTNLDTFGDVTLRKEFLFSPVASLEEAAARLNNDTAKLLEVINDGLRAEAQRENRDSADGWMETDKDGNITDKPFAGTIAHPKVVNAFVLNMAKTMFEYDNDAPKTERDAAKKAAIDFIKSQPKMVEGLKKRSVEQFAADAKKAAEGDAGEDANGE